MAQAFKPQDVLVFSTALPMISQGFCLFFRSESRYKDVPRGTARWTPTGGTPQGAVISPLLANLYLHPLDERMMARGYRMIRYADDFVILCESQAEAETALTEVRQWVDANGLQLHPDKTHVGDSRQAGQGFDFLGYRFEAGKRWVRKKSPTRIKDGIRAKTKRTRGESLSRVIADLNPMLRGWYGYFKHAHPSVFRKLDGFPRRRLRALLRKQEKRPGRGRCLADHQRWPMPSLRRSGCSPYIQPGKPRDTPDEESINWRAACGKTARTVRREGRLNGFSYPYRCCLNLTK